ncbi:uncharacterized protein MONOS_4384 [Monocercomonoides exilis]|uniref:uncharacterized protein n=1 Tax=Monocercomonoides exilis TaxID=2049356 RepID=UPI0035597BF7|nr:hypothetical protein MONOS_4384 [Monocercomonoides exilis]|eukprot:MONOS_4384.1-p1 / transcript=MONOS_4384.1 / gene=MONOS_4384 / organism=Monocercomonoides_exilis_PA203 / gene_product=unspecified product / transcript_product=unspecified product / location=Mono_scaffold00116:39517-48780(+) / protein_length=3088 / sequence_SO=supercontig / SO=protein_coding / is_pseudo=false
MLFAAIALIGLECKILCQEYFNATERESVGAINNIESEKLIPAHGNDPPGERSRSEISGNIRGELPSSFQNKNMKGNWAIDGKEFKIEERTEGGEHECKNDCNMKVQRQIMDEKTGIRKESHSKERVCLMKGYFNLKNASVGWRGLELESVKGKTTIFGTEGSRAALKGCMVVMSCCTALFEMHGGCAFLENITLQTSSPFLSEVSPLFSSKGTANKASDKSLLCVRFSCFSSFQISSPPFLASRLVECASLADLIFFNISASPLKCAPPATSLCETTCLMSSCSFSSVCDVYDGGIVYSLNNPLASLTASNTSFVGCCRTRNVNINGTAEAPLKLGRQSVTDDGANSFIWCEWNGSRTTGESDSWTDGMSSGGAICMYNVGNGGLSVSYCSFNNCVAYAYGGGIMCCSISSICIEDNVFNACLAQNIYGGGMFASRILTCARISGCEFQNCKANSQGGGLYLDRFQVSGTNCIGTENGEGESACVFDCSFNSCSLSDSYGGGMYCTNIPAAFKIKNIRFLFCSAVSHGGGLRLYTDKTTMPIDLHYCYFLFFHECICSANPPYGHDIAYADYHKHFLDSGNPFFECYSTNIDDRRMFYEHYDGTNWIHKHAEKSDWLKDKMIYVSVNGNDNLEQCGANSTIPCKTVKKAFEMSEIQISLTITLMEGNHTSETTTVEIGTKKISVIGSGKDKSSIGTGALLSTGALFSVSTGHIGLLHMKVDCNSNASPSSPSVVAVSDGSGSLSLEDVVITTSKTGEYMMSSSVFVVPLSQLLMADAEIKDMNVSKSLLSEPVLSPSSLSSSALYLTASASGDSVLANVKVRNVRLTEGDGVVVAKNVKAGETFVVKNVTIEDCECMNGSGGGIKVELLSPSSKLRVESSTTIKRCTSGKYGGGMMLCLADGSHDFSVVSVDFSGCIATSGGHFLFVNGSNSASWGISSSTLNVQHNESKYDELVGYDRSDSTMGMFPLNVFLDRYPDAAHVGKVKENGLGGYNTWFCGFDYYPCATITHTAQARYSGTNKNIELDSGFELVEEVAMTDEYEWEIFCGTKGMEVGVKASENFESSCLIEVLSKCSIRNIKFCIPSALSGASSLISTNSTLFTLVDCSVICSSEESIGYCFVKVIGGKLRMEQFEIRETLTFEGHSLIEFVEGVESVVFCGCDVNNVENKNGKGGWMNGVVGAERGDGRNGIIVIDGCLIKECRCCGGGGGGMFVSVKGEGSIVVNGSCVIDGCEAKSSEGSERKSEGKGGGMMIVMESRDGSLRIESGVEFSVETANRAKYGKDVFVHCGSGVLLETKINATSFSFFESNIIPSDVLKLCGSENGDESGVIPLFVYLSSIELKLTVDGRGDISSDHSHCGFEEFGCVTIDYCVNHRTNSSLHEVEVASESWIKSEMKVVSFDVSVSGKEEGTKVVVRDEGSINQNHLIECTKSFEMSNLAFVLSEEMNGRRSAFIHSSLSSTITFISCSVSFANDELIGYNVINIEGGELIVNGFVMEGGVTMNGKSPIVVTNGVKLEIVSSQMSDVEVKGVDGGCLNVEMADNGIVKLEECNLSSVCSGGSGMKGGGMKISVGKGGMLEMKNVKLSGCVVPSEESEEGGRGIGGGMFVKLPEEMGSFVMEGMEFEGCDGWKGKKVFVSGWNLSEIVKKEHLKWEIKEEELGWLDELCGWERKTTGEEGYVIPLVVYLWRNWSGDGFVDGEGGGDFSGCGFCEAPCSSIDHLISLRYPTLGEGEIHISIVGSGLLRSSISFSFSSSSSPASPDSELPKVVIEGTKKGTAVTISDEDENDLNESMISSNVSLSFVNASFTKPNTTTQHEIFIDSSGANSCLSVADCSFGSLRGITETAGYCLMRVNGGSVVIERCSLSLISELKGLIAFRPSAAEVTVQNVNISFADVKERSLISMMEEENQMNGKENTHSNGNKPILRIAGCSFTNITNERNGASAVDVGSFEDGVECVMDECSMTSCKSGLSTEGGGMRVVLKSEESVLKVNDSSFSMCKCPAETGCGGGLFIDGYDPNANYSDESQIPPLKLKIVNILFNFNEACVGKDTYIRCFSIPHQINESLFALNYNQESLNSNNSICGSDAMNEIDVDLIPLITFYYSAQVFVNGRGSDSRQCGAQSNPCSSINCGVDHIQEGVMNAILIDGEGFVRKECVIGDLVVSSYKKAQAIVRLKCQIEKSFDNDCILEFVNECSVERCSFQFEDGFESSHSCIINVKNGTIEMRNCVFFSSATTIEMKLNGSIVSVENGELKIFDSSFRDIHSISAVLSFHEEQNVIIDETNILNIECEGNVVSVGGKAKVEMKEMEVENVTLLLNGCVIGMDDAEQEMSVLNSSFGKCVNSVDKGSMMQIKNSKNVRVEICVFDGEKEEIVNEEVERKKEELCKWNGSLVDVENSKVEMRETTIMKSEGGGLRVSGGSVKIEKGEFENNNPLIEEYLSARRNVICTGNGELNVVSLKGGDGVKDNSSLWILNDGCDLRGIAGERASPFFIPVLDKVSVKEKGSDVVLKFEGSLFVPCDLSFRVACKTGDVELVETYPFEEDGFVSETEVIGVIPSENISTIGDETEVFVMILFGKQRVATSPQILKNKTESKTLNDKVVEGRNEGKSSWAAIIAIIFVVLFLIVLIALVIFIVRWKKQKRRTEELEVIVEDTVKKDPKAFEMVTMEMSPEEQWRRAEREAEKKNEERIKKRVYEKSLGHSESSEHLLSESGSTEYILGRDSDKIPDWALEKVEEEEETRKRSPSPSISSTSTTDTSDTESTFVRREDLCPTTSSMSNLVDAMECSSPHEKLILDLRDSFFMLMHGRNKTKEMAIGSVEEREVTGAQVLFWVANLALHSFDEMSNPLSSLVNLSPHIVLFSEHMDIAIALHSDCSSSSEDSDSSSISSLTIVSSSSSNVSVMSERFTDSPPPSSAFEDCEDNRDECKRWKAPELLMNRKMCATKQSVAFSIGMMLWECLTLEIPFGEYEAGIAGDKIVKGERPRLDVVENTTYGKLIGVCLSPGWEGRPMLSELKKEFFAHFPAEAKMLTVSDAIDVEEEEGGRNEHSGEEGSSMVDDGGNGNDVGNGDEEGDAKTTRQLLLR